MKYFWGFDKDKKIKRSGMHSFFYFFANHLFSGCRSILVFPKMIWIHLQNQSWVSGIVLLHFRGSRRSLNYLNLELLLLEQRLINLWNEAFLVWKNLTKQLLLWNVPISKIQRQVVFIKEKTLLLEWREIMQSPVCNTKPFRLKHTLDSPAFFSTAAESA